MKKVIICFVLCCLFSLSAITTEGFGNTPEEAKKEAVARLMSLFYGEYVSSRETISKEIKHDDISIDITKEITLSQYGRLYGLVYTQQREGNLYRVMASLEKSDELIEFYSARLRVLKYMMEEVIQEMSEISFNPCVYFDYQETLLEYSAEYEACVLILLYFDVELS